MATSPILSVDPIRSRRCPQRVSSVCLDRLVSVVCVDRLVGLHTLCFPIGVVSSLSHMQLLDDHSRCFAHLAILRFRESSHIACAVAAALYTDDVLGSG
eukprot:109525-Amphidinium_carterae.1